MDKLFFYSLDNVVRMLITAPILYAFVIGSIRVSGKRTTSQMNNFDWIVTVAMGSLVASGIVFKEVSLVESLLAMLLLLAMQYAMTRIVRSSKLARDLVKAQPRLLVRDGEFMEDAMRDERLTKSEVLAAIRGSGISRIEDVKAVILETDASMSVIRKQHGQPVDDDLSALNPVS